MVESTMGPEVWGLIGIPASLESSFFRNQACRDQHSIARDEKTLVMDRGSLFKGANVHAFNPVMTVNFGNNMT